jgi:hypothetical protein
VGRRVVSSKETKATIRQRQKVILRVTLGSTNECTKHLLLPFHYRSFIQCIKIHSFYTIIRMECIHIQPFIINILFKCRGYVFTFSLSLLIFCLSVGGTFSLLVASSAPDSRSQHNLVCLFLNRHELRFITKASHYRILRAPSKRTK